MLSLPHTPHALEMVKSRESDGSGDATPGASATSSTLYEFSPSFAALPAPSSFGPLAALPAPAQ